MKNERAIEELLVEMLRNQDRQEEILLQNGQILQSTQSILQSIQAEQQTQLKVYESGFTAILDRFTEFTTEVKGFGEDFKKFTNQEDRIKKLEDIVFSRDT